MPGQEQQQTIADKLVTATFATIATYFQKNPSARDQRYARGEDRRISRGSGGFASDFMQSFTR
jgi:hypothetical protein